MRCDGSFDESLPRQTKSFSWGFQSQENLNCSPQIDLAKVDPGKIALVVLDLILASDPSLPPVHSSPITPVHYSPTC